MVTSNVLDTSTKISYTNAGGTITEDKVEATTTQGTIDLVVSLIYLLECLK